MSFAKLCGYDVNGFRDLAARNWEILEDGEEQIVEAGKINRGAFLSSVVQVGEGKTARWIGGAQADLAPHGRGGGWGEVGSKERRVVTREMLTSEGMEPAAFAAAFTGLSASGSTNVVAIDEHDLRDERVREQLLAALQKARMSNPMLVWRSVLAVLHHHSTAPLQVGQTIGVINHVAKGLSIQVMRILEADGVIAPERRQNAQLIETSLGFEEIARDARMTVLGDDRITARNEHRLRAKMVGSMVLGEPIQSELLREGYGRWDHIDAIPGPVPASALSVDDFASLVDCDLILFESLARGEIQATARSACEMALGRPLHSLPPEAVALGALEAARRVQRRQPVFFDFLPQVSTIVQTRGRAENFDLIGAGDTVEAGRLYRSHEPAQLALPARRESVEVYLRKEAVAEPRKATVQLGDPLARAVPVSLLVEQKPAAGRARILLEARDLGRQFTVDWDDAEILPVSWQELIDSQQPDLPICPDRLVLDSGMAAWENGLPELIEENLHCKEVDWKALADRMRARVDNVSCISSDGALPAELPASTVSMLDALNERAMAETRERLAAKRNARNNEALGFLTWQYRRCPQGLVQILQECREGYGRADFSHPFIWTHLNWVLIYQALARITDDPAIEAKLLHEICDAEPFESDWRTRTACAAMLLSRSESAPSVLDRTRIEALARRALAELRSLVGSTYTRFLYARFLLGGILRWRMIDPYAFIPEVDPLGSDLQQAVRDILDDLAWRGASVPEVAKAERRMRPTFEGLLKALKGESVDPNDPCGGGNGLLLNIYLTS